MRVLLPPLRLVAFGALILAGAGGLARAGDVPTVSFSRDVLPILSENCLLCHGPDSKARKADLRLDQQASALRTKDPIIVPGKSGDSELIRRVESDDAEEVMPPPKSGHKLRPQQKETLRRWVDQGARWGKHWAFEPPAQVAPPPVKDAAWVKNPIDAFVLARLEEEGLKPAPPADRATLIRRLSLDLTGLPPTLAEVDAFVADSSPKAYEALVDRLLGSAHYGERMAMDWLDAARYADTNGYQNDFARTMWPWRDWVIVSFNRNQPFDQFLIDQIAGDLAPGSTRTQKMATGFNRNNRTVTEAGSIDEEWRIENAVDRVETTATVFLGLTLGCGRCHDHKYDPITQREFYQFLAFFNSVREKGVYTEQKGNVPPLIPVADPDQERRLQELAQALAEASKAREAASRELPERRRAWERKQAGAPDPCESRDWSLRCLLDEGFHFQGPAGETVEGTWRGTKPPAWTDGPLGKALRLPGRDDAVVEVNRGPSLDRTDRFSYGGWIRSEGDGAGLSKMDDRGGYRGYDLLVSGGKVAVHLVSSWPADALKVVTRAALPRKTWTHVMVTYDGSSKARGLSIYFDGRAVEVDVQSDTLRNSTATPQPLRLGRRSTSEPFRGDLADLRIYRRTLSAGDVRELATAPLLSLAAMPSARRTKLQEALVEGYFKAHVDHAWRQAESALTKIRAQKREFEERLPTVMVMEDQPTRRPTFVLKRGRYDMPDANQPVQPGVPACLGTLAADAPRNRLGLARWLASADNPLTARVAVNRLWQQHFGMGLVKTAENFGVQGEPPSHPALLDWLAVQLVRTGWDVKAMHRLIVQSATYRQASQAPEPLYQRDPDNRLLARGPRLRLPAEVVRDNALAIAGLLTLKIGGPSIKPYQPAGLWEELAGGAGEGPYVQDKGEKLYRRSLYVYRKRTVPHPAMANFDAPSREICQVKRARTNTPLQALELLNDVTYVEAANHLARRMLTECRGSPSERLSYGFRLATARRPGAPELEVLQRGLERYQKTFRVDPQSALRWIKEGETPATRDVDSIDLAAYSATAGVLLNLDETISRE
jgi:hypothetical protein